MEVAIKAHRWQSAIPKMILALGNRLSAAWKAQCDYEHVNNHIQDIRLKYEIHRMRF